MTAPELVAKVLACGFRIGLTAGGPVLIQAVRDAHPLPAALLAELKRDGDAVIAHLAKHQCRPCGRVVECEEDRRRLAGPNVFCGETQCPYRKRG